MPETEKGREVARRREILELCEAQARVYESRAALARGEVRKAERRLAEALESEESGS